MLLPLLANCSRNDLKNPYNQNESKPEYVVTRPTSIGVVGDTTDVTTATKFGLVVMGGGADVDAAFRWMINRSGGGDVVVLRASGNDAYNSYIKGLGSVNSVETLKIDSRKLAEDDKVANIIRNAEMLFIAGGDQADYVRYWKGTKVMKAINYLMNDKKVPVGGTSAGAAILGYYYFGAERGGVTSEEALFNPYYDNIIIGQGDFLNTPFLSNVIIDQHFSQRSREGRMSVFLSRIMKDWNKSAYGIAVDEKTAICIDEVGMADVLGYNKAFFIKTDANKQPESIPSRMPLTWNHDAKALSVYVLSNDNTNSKFDLTTFSPQTSSQPEKLWWSVISGVWQSNNQ